MSEINFDSIDSILDATLDDLADMPEFKPFPAGTHACLLTMSTKAINGKPAVEWKLTAVETIELKSPEDIPVKQGDTCNGVFMFIQKDGKPNEVAQGQFKEMLKPLAVHFNTATNRATLEAIAGGVHVAVTMSQRADKTNPNKFYPVIEALSVL
jgi:hypothetical protein